MRLRSHCSGLRAWIAALLLLCVPGCLFAHVAGAGPAFVPAELEIDLSDNQRWKVRARGELRYGVDGKVVLPWITEGLTSKRALVWHHRRAAIGKGSTVETFRQTLGEGFRDRLSEFGYRPGDRIEVDYAFSLEASPEGHIDQAFVLGGDHPGGAAIRVLGEISGIQRDVQGFREGPGSSDGDRPILHFERPAKAYSRIWFDRMASSPRLILSSHRDAVSLGRAILSEFRKLERNADDMRPVRAMHTASSPLETLGNTLREIEAMNPPILQRSWPIRRQLASVRKPEGAGSVPALTPVKWAMIAQAQLAKAGIASQIVLTNRRAIPREAPVPVTLFDTAILFVPQFGRFLDPATGSASDFALSPALAGHAALVLGDEGASWTRLPFGKAENNRILTRAELQVGPDGSLEGQSLTEATGEAAIHLRQMVERIGRSQKKGALAELMERQGLDGVASLGQSEDQGLQFRQHLLFQVAAGQGDNLALELALSPGPRLYRPPLLELLPALQDPNVSEVSCRALRLEQEIVFHLPDRRVPTELPSVVQMETRYGTFRARYRAGQQKLIVERMLEIRNPDPICRREVILELAPMLRAASRDFARKLQLRSPGG